MRGRKPKPTVLKLMNNNPGRRPLNASEPTPEALDAERPTELGDDPVALQEWTDRIVPAIERGQITSAERIVAISHCLLVSTWLSQLADAARHPHIVASGPHKHPIPNPARGAANKTLLLLLRVDEQLGLTPSSRSRVTASKPNGQATSPLALLQARVGNKPR
jgi:phage terminase small subunit